MVTHSFSLICRRHLFTTHCTLLFSKRLCIYVNVMVSNGGMISITLKVASSLLVRLIKPQHFESLKNREWFVGGTKVKELYECKNFGVLKNYAGSFSSNIDDYIDETSKKVGMIFSSNLDRRKVNPISNPLIYVKFWRQACPPPLAVVWRSAFCTFSHFTMKT